MHGHLNVKCRKYNSEFKNVTQRCCQQKCVTYTTAVCTGKSPDDWQRNCSKHIEFYSKNKFEELMHLVGLL